MKLTSIILIIFIFISCSPIQRHARIVKKFPYVHRVDSVKLIDTIRINTNKVISDTVVHENYLLDTIVLTKDNLTVKVLRFRDSIYINGECDTIFVEKIIERNIPVKYYKENKKNTFYWQIFAVILILIIIYTKR
jgi:hypothetical protein